MRAIVKKTYNDLSYKQKERIKEYITELATEAL